MCHMLLKFHIGCGLDRDGAPVTQADLDHARRMIMLRLSREFGGATLNYVTGAWVDPNGNLVLERSMVIECVAKVTDNVPPRPTDTLPNLMQLKDIAETVAAYAREALHQSSVLYTIQRLESAMFVEA